MLSLLDVVNKNLGTDYKNVEEFAADAAKEKIDMTIIAETLYQYMYYQQAINNADIESFKVTLSVNEKQANV